MLVHRVDSITVSSRFGSDINGRVVLCTKLKARQGEFFRVNNGRGRDEYLSCAGESVIPGNWDPGWMSSSRQVT